MQTWKMIFLSEGDYFPEGTCPEVTVYDRDQRESPVLDQHGRPFLMGRPFKIGFDFHHPLTLGVSSEVVTVKVNIMVPSVKFVGMFKIVRIPWRRCGLLSRQSTTHLILTSRSTLTPSSDYRTPMSTKRCTVCEQEVPVELFYKRAASEDNLAYRCKPCDKLAGQKYRKLNKEKDRQSRKWERVRRLYGLTEASYLNLWEAQGGKCKVCSQALKEGWTKNHDKHRAVVDHCHTTGKVRGLLCTMCNKGVGLLGDNSEGLYKAYEYLLDFEKKEVH